MLLCLLPVPFMIHVSQTDVNMSNMSCFWKTEVCLHLMSMEKMWTKCYGEVSNAANKRALMGLFSFLYFFWAYFRIVDVSFGILGGHWKKAVYLCDLRWPLCMVTESKPYLHIPDVWKRKWMRENNNLSQEEIVKRLGLANHGERTLPRIL